VLTDSLDDAWIKSDGDEISDVFSRGGKAVGAFIASGRLLEKSIMDSMSIRSFVQEHMGRDKVRLRKFSDSYWMRLDSDRNNAEKAEDLIFAQVASRDGLAVEKYQQQDIAPDEQAPG
jgi:hypothetical protein